MRSGCLFKLECLNLYRINSVSYFLSPWSPADLHSPQIPEPRICLAFPFPISLANSLSSLPIFLLFSQLHEIMLNPPFPFEPMRFSHRAQLSNMAAVQCGIFVRHISWHRLFFSTRSVTVAEEGQTGYWQGDQRHPPHAKTWVTSDRSHIFNVGIIVYQQTVWLAF